MIRLKRYWVLIVVILGVGYHLYYRDYFDHMPLVVEDESITLLIRDSDTIAVVIFDQMTNSKKCKYYVYEKSSQSNDFEVFESGELNEMEILKVSDFVFNWSIKSDRLGYLYLNASPNWNLLRGKMYYAKLNRLDLSMLHKLDSIELIKNPFVFCPS